MDIPDSVLGQLGNRVQHALRGYTPKDQKAIRAAAETFRQNPAYSVQEVITELGVGEALISFLDEKGRPSIVERSIILPPRSQIGPVLLEKRKEELYKSPFRGKYEQAIDRESAYEYMQKRAVQEAEQRAAEAEMAANRKLAEARAKEDARAQRSARSASNKDTVVDKVLKSAATSIGRQVAQGLVRGILGSFLKR